MNDQEFKSFLMDTWLPALRSGDYEQGKEALLLQEPYHGKYIGYCCLGVAAVCMGYKKSKIKTRGISHGSGEPSYHENNKGDILKVYQRLRSLTDGHDLDIVDTLIDLNDNDVPFERIADYIEGSYRLPLLMMEFDRREIEWCHATDAEWQELRDALKEEANVL